MSVEQLRARVVELEEALRKIEEQIAVHEQVFFQNPIPAIVYSVENLAILNANQSAIELYGYRLDEFRTLKLTDLFAPSAVSVCLEQELRKPISSLNAVQHRTAAGRNLIVTLVSFAFETKGVNARMAMVED